MCIYSYTYTHLTHNIPILLTCIVDEVGNFLGLDEEGKAIDLSALEDIDLDDDDE